MGHNYSFRGHKLSDVV